MKSKISRICICLFAALMVFISMPVMNASAARETSDGIKYKISDGKVTITDYTGTAKNLTIPSSIDGYPVTSIGGGVFYSCDSLTSITIPEGVTSIGSTAFSDCSALKRMVVDKNNPVYDSRDNCNAIIETATNTLIAGCSKTEIPSSVTRIGDDAFWHCYSLTSIEIPSSVTSIGEYAFWCCSSLTSIEIPSSVTSIGGAAFACCSSLERMIVDKNNRVFDSRNNCNAIIETATNTLIAGCSKTVIPSSVTSIGNSAFWNCKSLTSIVIPSGVTSIGEYAFAYCYSLTSIEIPSSVTSIGKGAFCDCDSLSNVYYTGSEADWNKIIIGSENGDLTSANMHFDKQSTTSKPTETEPPETAPTGTERTPTNTESTETAPTKTESQTSQAQNTSMESDSEKQGNEGVSTGVKIIGFSLIAVIILAVAVMWIFIIKKNRKG